jgi:hypothetical protein
LLVAPLLQVDIGGVIELPLRRNIMVTMNEQIKTKMNKINKTQQKMVGPLMWQPIEDQR